MKHNRNTSLFSTIGRSMRCIMILLEDSFEQKDIALNLPQFIILNILFMREGMILEELAKILHKDKSAVLRHLNQLKSNHLIAKMPDKADKRRKILMLTQKGIEVLKRARIIERKLQESLTEQLEDKDIELFIKVLDQMRNQAHIQLNKQIDKVN